MSSTPAPSTRPGSRSRAVLRRRCFEKTKGPNKDGKDEEKWRQTAPSAKDLEAASVDALLSSLTTARAETVVPDMPSGVKPEAIVSLTFDDGKQERVIFYRSWQ